MKERNSEESAGDIPRVSCILRQQGEAGEAAANVLHRLTAY